MGIESPNHEDHFQYTEEQRGELMSELLGSGMSEQEAVEEIVRREEATIG